jgi:tol-pal system protein YbgF
VKRLLISTIIAAALVAAAPAHAQRQSLADRVAALETKAANDRGNTDLLNQMTQLRTELQEMRALVEQLQNENEQLKQTNKDQYLDLDGRLNRIEGGAAPAVPAMTPPPPLAPPPATGAAVPAAERAPSVHGDVGAMAQSGDERAAYNVAFDALKGGNYADAAQLFLSFLELYPNGAYTPNALYWLGESYYVTQNYELAVEAFTTLLRNYRDSRKEPDALLKLGYCQIALGDRDGGELTLRELVSRHPGTDAAAKAESRLRTLAIENR